ncbi:CPO, partial [Symbiodinium necroappetens]
AGASGGRMSDRAPDGQLARVSTDPYDGRRYWYLGADRFENVDAAFPEFGAFFAVMIFCEAGKKDYRAISDLAARLTRRGASTVHCWGPGCEQVHDLFDDVYVVDEIGVLEQDGIERPRSYVFLQHTYWHTERSLREASNWFLELTRPWEAADHTHSESPEWHCLDWLVIVVGDHDEWKDEVWGYLLDPESTEEEPTPDEIQRRRQILKHAEWLERRESSPDALVAPDRAPDNQLTLVPNAFSDTSRYWYLAADQLDDVDALLEGLGSPFILFLACETEEMDFDTLKAQITPVLRRGCSSVCCWGPSCQRNETAFDFASIELDEAGTEHPDKVLMTTAHADDSLADAFWFFHMCTRPLEADRLVVIVGDHDDWKDEIWGYLADPRSSFADEDAPEAAPEPTTLETIRAEADAYAEHCETPLARDFLASAQDLPAITEPRVVFYNREAGAAMTAEEYERASEAEREGFERTEVGERYYYLTRFGTPVAYARGLEIVSPFLDGSVDGKRVFDFGHGGIGQLRMLASLGADVVGCDISTLNGAVYAGDLGEVGRAEIAGEGENGSVDLLVGRFPAEKDIIERAGAGYDLVMSKNTLKLGYIHPEREADPRTVIDLGATDEEFLDAVHAMLNEGGVFLIYNLYPKPSAPDEPYRTWADGRCPFARELCEAQGFDVLIYNRDDTDAAHAMGKSFGWEDTYDFETDLFGMVTVLRKRRAIRLTPPFSEIDSFQSSAHGEKGRGSESSAALGWSRCALGASAVLFLAGAPASADTVIDWNLMLRDATRAQTGVAAAPGPVARAGAMLHAAIFDAVNAVDRTHTSAMVDIKAAPGTDKFAAAAAAGHATLSTLYGSNAGLQAQFDAMFASQMASIPAGPGRDAGVALGQSIASSVISGRAGDGHDAPFSYTESPAPGQWRSNYAPGAPAWGPQWGDVTPWVLNSGDQFRPGPPPSLTSQEYTDAWNEVYHKGRATGSTRTADETEVAWFWGNDRDGTMKPPGHVNRIAEIVANDRLAGLSESERLSQSARLFALVNVGMLDASVAAWDSKYNTDNDFWRPIAGIREADTDGNINTISDPTWEPLSHIGVGGDPFSPPFPAYVSGHATFAAVGSSLIAQFFGTDEISFVLDTDDVDANGAVRSFDRLSDAAWENALSRVFLGVHWRFDAVAGNELGYDVGEYFFENFLVEIPAPGVPFAFAAIGAFGFTRRRRG